MPRKPLVLSVKSPKHPGAVFLVYNGTDDFICKVYPRHAHEAEAIKKFIEEETRERSYARRLPNL